jgi:hypothetical protein
MTVLWPNYDVSWRQHVVSKRDYCVQGNHMLWLNLITVMCSSWRLTGMSSREHHAFCRFEVARSSTCIAGTHLTLSNPIFLPHAHSPALIYFGLERGWWITCPYYMRKSVGQAPTAEWENKRNKKSVGRLPTLERNRKIIMSDEVRRWIGKG